MKQLLILFILACQIASAHAKDYLVTDYRSGADTTQLASVAINAAIDACHQEGGGRVVVPKGNYRCGTIFLKSNVELHLEAGAYIYATSGYEAFPMQPRNHYRSQKDAAGWNALIYAADAHHIAVTGSGTIDGKGAGRRGYISNVPGDGNGRPKNILFISCQNVRVSGITMLNAAMWNQHYLNCEDVWVDGITVSNHCNGNNDGIDIDGCRRFTLTNSTIDSDDDAIVLKSTGSAPCEDIIVRGCIVSSYCNAIKCGTESSGGFKNILISDCIVKPSSFTGERIVKSTPTGITAISLEIVDGGIMENVMVDNILIKGTECPLYIRLADRGRKYVEDMPRPAIGSMSNISISNVRAYDTGNFCASITGVPTGRIQNVSLTNIEFVNRGGLKKGDYRRKGDMDGMRHDLSNQMFATRYWKTHQEVDEDVEGYPQPTVWGNLPSYGLFVRHVDGVRLNNVVFRSTGTEPRVPVVAADVTRLTAFACDFSIERH
jgi:polygalacturonase